MLMYKEEKKKKRKNVRFGQRNRGGLRGEKRAEEALTASERGAHDARRRGEGQRESLFEDGEQRARRRRAPVRRRVVARRRSGSRSTSQRC